eukprot:5912913-Alexandrium_andersonii.AAC.1
MLQSTRVRSEAAVEAELQERGSSSTAAGAAAETAPQQGLRTKQIRRRSCLLYTSDAADDM